MAKIYRFCHIPLCYRVIITDSYAWLESINYATYYYAIHGFCHFNALMTPNVNSIHNRVDSQLIAPPRGKLRQANFSAHGSTFFNHCSTMLATHQMTKLVSELCTFIQWDWLFWFQRTFTFWPWMFILTYQLSNLTEVLDKNQYNWSFFAQN